MKETTVQLVTSAGSLVAVLDFAIDNAATLATLRAKYGWVSIETCLATAADLKRLKAEVLKPKCMDAALTGLGL